MRAVNEDDLHRRGELRLRGPVGAGAPPALTGRLALDREVADAAERMPRTRIATTEIRPVPGETAPRSARSPAWYLALRPR
jgi:hypothetical protein